MKDHRLRGALGVQDLENLGVVVSDEIHYINDSERGIVWEETLIHLPPSVQVGRPPPHPEH